MKIFKKLLFACFLFSLCTLSHSVFSQSETGKDYFRGLPVTSIEVDGPFHIILKESLDSYIRPLADNSLMQQVVLEYKSGKVSLTYKGSSKNLQNTALPVHVFLPKLKEVKLENSCLLTIDGVFNFDDVNFTLKSESTINNAHISAKSIDFDIEKASSVSIEKLDVKNIKIELDDASYFEAFLSNSKNVKIQSSNASKCKIHGVCNNLEIDAKSASSLNCNNLSSKNAEVSLTGASNASIQVSAKLEIDLKGASSLKYRGLPLIKKQKVVENSKVEKTE